MAEENVQEEDFSAHLQGDEQAPTEITKNYSELLNTHKKTNKTYAGTILNLEKNYSKTTFSTTLEMSVDELGLIHSGYIFSAADYAAAIAVNEENTVIIGSKISFLAPAKAGDIVEFEARVKFEDLRKREVNVEGKINDIKVFDGTFYVIVLEKHIFKTKIKNVKREY